MFKVDMSNVKMSLYNVDTGEKVMDADDIKEVKMDVNTKYETTYDNEEHKFNSKMFASDYEMSFNCDMTDLNIDALFGIDMAKKPDAYDITFIKMVQCRIHKRKRINKKWAKRYGYKPITVTPKGWQINTYTDGTFEFKKDIK